MQEAGSPQHNGDHLPGEVRENGDKLGSGSGSGVVKLERPGSRSGSCSSNRSTPSLKSKDVRWVLYVFWLLGVLFCISGEVWYHSLLQ